LTDNYVKNEGLTPKPSSTDDSAPSINGDGTKIAYYGDDGSDYEIYFVEFTGGAWQASVQVTSNTTGDSAPSINGDGTKIAYYGNAGSDDQIYFVEDIQPAPAAIPTLSKWGMIIMALLLAAFAFWMVRRKTTQGMAA